MLRLVLHSQDRKLGPILNATLGQTFSIQVVTGTDSLNVVLGGAPADVLLVDLDSNYS